jgi:hypothetical protein
MCRGYSNGAVERHETSYAWGRSLARGEQVVREDGEPFDLARHRSFIGAAEPRAVGGVDHDRLPAHGQVAIAGAVDVQLPDECRVGCGDAADQEGGHVRLLPAGELLEHLRNSSSSL